MRVIELNVGYYNTKWFNNGSHSTFETRVQKNSNCQNGYIVYNGAKYEVGQGQRSIERRNQNFVHLICTYYAVASQCQDGEHVTLLVALPMSHYLNEMFRIDYITSIKKNSPLICEVDGLVKKIYIDEVVCYMEGASAVLNNVEFFVGKACGLIDIGGNTVNGAIFNNCKLLSETVTTLDLGTIKIEKQMIDNINLLNGWNVQDYELPYLINNKNLVVDNVTSEIYDTTVKAIRNKLLEKKWGLGSLPLFFTGGGSLVLSKYIDKNFTNYTISKNCLFDNLDGLSVVKGEIQRDKECIH